MKKLLLLFLVCFACSTVVAEKVFDDWVYPGESFSFDQRAASMDLSQNDNIRIRLDTGEFIVIPPGGEERMGTYTFQYIQIDKEICQHSGCTPKKYGKIDPVTSLTVPGVKLIIESLEPELKITRTFTETTLLLNKEVTVDVEIKNEGNLIAQNVRYLEVFPDAFMITRTTKGAIIGSSIEAAAGSLQPEGIYRFSYKVKMISRVDTKVKAKATYTYDGALGEAYSSEVNLKPRDTFLVTSSLDPTALKPGNVTTITLKVQNTNPLRTEKAKLKSLRLFVSPQLEIMEYDRDFVRTGQALLLEDVDFDPQEQRNYTFELKAESYGAFVMNGTLDSFFREVLPTVPVKINVPYTKDTTTHDYELVLAPSTRDYLEGDTAYVSLIVLNKDLFNLTDIRAKIDVNGTIYEFNHALLEPNKDHRFTQLATPLPLVTKSQSLKVTAQVTMKSGFDGAFINKTLTSTITVKDILEAFTITKKLDPSTLKQNETGVVTVQIKNNLQYGSVAGIRMFEEVPQQFSPSAVPAKTINLDYGDTVDVFAYTITAPFKYDTSASQLMTYVVGNNQTMNKSQKVTVTLEKPTITFTRTYPTTGTLGAIIEDRIKIANTGKVGVYNVYMQPTAAPGIDIAADAPAMQTADLASGEEVSFLIKERLSRSGTITAPALQVSYQDKHGNRYFTTVPTKTIAVASVPLTDPVFSIDRSVVKITNEQISVEATISNSGGMSEINYTDDTTQKSIILDQGAQENFLYTITVGPVEEFYLMPAQLTYVFEGELWTAASSAIIMNRTLEPETILLNGSQEKNASLLRSTSSYGGKKSTGDSKDMFTIIIIIGITAILGFIGFKLIRKRILVKKQGTLFSELNQEITKGN